VLTKAIADPRSPLGEPPEPQMPPKFSRKKVSFEISNWRNSGVRWIAFISNHMSLR
jgi:hypothetical protein